MKKSAIVIMMAAVFAVSICGCGDKKQADDNAIVSNASPENTTGADQEGADQEGKDQAIADTQGSETVADDNSAVSSEETDDLYEKIAKDVIALSVNPDAEFDYGEEIVIKSIEKDANTGSNVVNVIISRELGDNVFPRIIGEINKSIGDTGVVGMEEEPENVRNVKVNILNPEDGSFICTRAAIHDENDGTYLITYYGEF